MNTPSSLRLPMWRIFSSTSLAILALIIFPALTAAQTITYSNTSSITLPNNNVASTYPSTINVSGGTGVVTKVTVALNGVTQRPADLDILLVGPTGVKVILTEDRGGNTAVTNQNWVYDDGAASMMGTSNGNGVSGTYMPSHDGTFTSLPSPAPASTGGSPYSGQLSSFIGTNGNGDWTLYIDDDSSQGSAGSLSGGWSITISYGQVFTSSGSVTIPGTGTGPAVASVYPAPIDVSGYSGSAITKVTVRLNTFAHTWPEDVGMLLVGPGGQSVRLMADVGGSGDFSGNLIFDSTASKSIMDNGTTAIPAGTYLPSSGDDTATGGSDPMPANFPAPAPASPYGANLNVFNWTQPNGTWNLYIYDDTASDVGSLASWSLILETVAPTSAPADISGRVLTPKGQGIRSIVVTVQGGDLEAPMATVTSTFGAYRFSGLTAGQTYILSVSGKKYLFENPIRVVNLDDSLSDIDFVSY